MTHVWSGVLPWSIPWMGTGVCEDNKASQTLLALALNKMLYVYLLCTHSEHQKTAVPI